MRNIDSVQFHAMMISIVFIDLNHFDSGHTKSKVLCHALYILNVKMGAALGFPLKLNT